MGSGRLRKIKVERKAKQRERVRLRGVCFGGERSGGLISR
jgi:hypothetical protein